MNSQVVKHCSNDRAISSLFYIYLENPSAIFRFFNSTNIGETFVLKETKSASSIISNISTQQLFVYDEIYMSGSFVDSNSVDNFYVLSIGRTVTTATVIKY